MTTVATGWISGWWITTFGSGPLSRCDELWIAGGWRESKGCCMEYGYAKSKGIPIKFIGEEN